MSLYYDKINYFKNLSETDPNIAHGKDGNVSFFDITDEDALLAAITNNIHYPFVWVENMKSSLQNPDSGINQNYNWSLRFYTKIEMDNFDDKQTATQAAYDLALEITEQWQRRIIHDGYNDDSATVFQNVDIGSFAISKLGIFGDNYVGWNLRFTEMHVNDILDYILPEPNYWT